MPSPHAADVSAGLLHEAEHHAEQRHAQNTEASYGLTMVKVFYND
jgi:hypothetical protein